MFVCLFIYWLIYSSPNLFFKKGSFLCGEGAAHFAVSWAATPFQWVRGEIAPLPTAAGPLRCSRCSGSSAPLLSPNTRLAPPWGGGGGRRGSEFPGSRVPTPLPWQPPGSRRRHRGNPGGATRDLRCEEPAGPLEPLRNPGSRELGFLEPGKPRHYGPRAGGAETRPGGRRSCRPYRPGREESMSHEGGGGRGRRLPK